MIWRLTRQEENSFAPGHTGLSNCKSPTRSVSARKNKRISIRVKPLCNALLQMPQLLVVPSPPASRSGHATPKCVANQFSWFDACINVGGNGDGTTVGREPTADNRKNARPDARTRLFSQRPCAKHPHASLSLTRTLLVDW